LSQPTLQNAVFTPCLFKTRLLPLSRQVEQEKMTIEVFKTNVEDKEEADKIIEAIHQSFEDHKANFDLQDCDKILRVVSANEYLQATSVIQLVKTLGYHAEILPDN
jgi:mevalonate kinase